MAPSNLPSIVILGILLSVVSTNFGVCMTFALDPFIYSYGTLALRLKHVAAALVMVGTMVKYLIHVWTASGPVRRVLAETREAEQHAMQASDDNSGSSSTHNAKDIAVPAQTQHAASTPKTEDRSAILLGPIAALSIDICTDETGLFFVRANRADRSSTPSTGSTERPIATNNADKDANTSTTNHLRLVLTIDTSVAPNSSVAPLRYTLLPHRSTLAPEIEAEISRAERRQAEHVVRKTLEALSRMTGANMDISGMALQHLLAEMDIPGISKVEMKNADKEKEGEGEKLRKVSQEELETLGIAEMDGGTADDVVEDERQTVLNRVEKGLAELQGSLKRLSDTVAVAHETGVGIPELAAAGVENGADASETQETDAAVPASVTGSVRARTRTSKKSKVTAQDGVQSKLEAQHAIVWG